jgi:hypothetical protein
MWKIKIKKCEERFSSYVWRGVHGKGVCKNQTWKEVVCSKASGFLVQLVVPLKSTVGFVSKLNQS